MFPYLMSDPRMTDPRTKELRNRLDRFYNSTTSYCAFNSDPDQTVWLSLLEPIIDELFEEHNRIRILECGAGRPGFSRLYKDKMSRIEFHVQDITSANRNYLEAVADRVHICDVSEMTETYHLIFSTFVLEHVANPTEFLAEIKRLLIPGGIHVVFSPRYDFPGYVCPSLRCLSLSARLWINALILISKLQTKVIGRTRFWVNCNPAVLHGCTFRDADAVHLVSRADVECWHRQFGFKVQTLKPPATGWRDYICKRLITLSLMARKHEK